jgi:hypothetical protein
LLGVAKLTVFLSQAFTKQVQTNEGVSQIILFSNDNTEIMRGVVCSVQTELDDLFGAGNESNHDHQEQNNPFMFYRAHMQALVLPFDTALYKNVATTTIERITKAS